MTIQTFSMQNTNEAGPMNPAFPIHPEQDPVELLLTRLQMVGTDDDAVKQLVQWVESASKHLSPDEIREPNIRIHYFFQHSSSLVELAHRYWNRIEDRAQHYGPERLDLLARYLIAVRLIVRYREQANQSKSATPEIDKIAAFRDWKNTGDVVRDLSEVEDRLVTFGAAALIDNPSAQEAFLADQDDGSFQDQFDDVRRRVDMAREHAALFDAVGITEDELEMTDKMLQDADIFYRGREARSIFAKQLTELRNKAFTLAFMEMEKLQLILQAVTYGDSTIADHIGGKFWKRLNRLSRKRRNRTQDGSEETAATENSPTNGAVEVQGTEATTPTPQDKAEPQDPQEAESNN